MSRLLALTLLLAGALAEWFARGLPQSARAERAWQALRERETSLRAAQREIGPLDYDEFVQLSRRHEQASARLAQRRAALTEGGSQPPVPALPALLEATRIDGLRRPSPLADRLLAEAATSADSAACLAAIVHALPEAEDLEVEDLLLRDGGRPHDLSPSAGLRAVDAQLVVTGALPDVLGALEGLAPERGTGLPLLMLRSASLRRIEPELWGSDVHRISSPPVRLSVTLGVLLAADGVAP